MTDDEVDRVRDAATRLRRAFEEGGFGSHWLRTFPANACGMGSEMLGQYLRDSGLGDWAYRSGPVPATSIIHGWIERGG
jgi:hypothetical protein